MTALMLIWLKFALAAAVIGIAGYRLSLCGDVIAEKTGLSGSWIGLILISTVTSLPELVTGVSAVAVAEAPNIALGDALGSCVFNLLLIVVLDLLYRKEPLYTRASQGHILSAGFGVILIGFVGFTILLAQQTGHLSFGHVGIYSPVIILSYLLAMRILFAYEQRGMAALAEKESLRYPHLRLRDAVIRYALAALAVVGAGVWLPFIGIELAGVMHWHTSFVGSLFIAFATSLPELAVTLSALRLGALDMAVANLFGSNLLNVMIIAIDDIFYLPGPLFSHVSSVHAATALSAVIMTGTATVGLIYRPRTRLFKAVGWVSMALFAIYLLNSYILYLHG